MQAHRPCVVNFLVWAWIDRELPSSNLFLVGVGIRDEEARAVSWGLNCVVLPLFQSAGSSFLALCFLALLGSGFVVGKQYDISR